jgi:long-chain acyl-CoA synthetase
MSRIHLAQFLERAARHAPTGAAIRFEARQSTWASLNRASQELAGGLRDLGVTKGDRVAILALNCDRYVEVQFGCWRVSAVVVPLNTRWSAAEINYALKDSAPKILVVDDAFVPMLPALELDSRATRVVFIGDGQLPVDATPYDALRGRAPLVTELGGGGDDVAGIFYTGGTTGYPKGVMLAHTSLVATLLAARVSHDNTTDRRPLLCVLPMFHLAGAQLAIAAAIATVPLVMQKGFDPAAILESIQRDRIDTLSLVPAMWRMLLSHPNASTTDFSSLKRAAYGASPMPAGILRQCLAQLPGAEFSQGYGQTETAGICTLLGPEDHDPDGPHAHRLRSAGKPILFCELKIIDEDGRDVAPGTVGEITIRGSGNMLGYWNRPEETAKTLRDGWIHTGDAGYIDTDGYVYIVDRTKDMIISGGENIYSAETESALSLHPDVAECAVIGVPDDKWGERVHAVVRLKPGAPENAEALIQFCKTRIAGYKCPATVTFVSEPLPLSAAGKVLKRELRAPFWKGRDRAVN